MEPSNTPIKNEMEVEGNADSVEDEWQIIVVEAKTAESKALAHAPRPNINRSKFFQPTMTTNEEGEEVEVNAKFKNAPLQPLLCCLATRLQPKRASSEMTEAERQQLHFMILILNSTNIPENACYGAPSIPGRSFWLDYYFLFATVAEDNEGKTRVRYFGVKDNIAKDGISGSWDEILVEHKPKMLTLEGYKKHDDTKEVLVRSPGIEYKCPIHTMFREIHAYCINYIPKTSSGPTH